MACMEHMCKDCGELVMNNDTPIMMKEVPCPKCGKNNWASVCDEIPERHDLDDTEVR